MSIMATSYKKKYQVWNTSLKQGHGDVNYGYKLKKNNIKFEILHLNRVKEDVNYGYKLKYQVWNTSLKLSQERCQLWLQAKISSLKYFT